MMKRDTKDVRALVSRAVEGLIQSPHGCSHARDGSRPLAMCVHHPAAGVMCHGCMHDHLGRHAIDEVCSYCRRTGDTVVQIESISIPLRNLSFAGGSHEIAIPLGDMTVNLFGLLSCAACRVEPRAN
jgi:hypothetical protein